MSDYADDTGRQKYDQHRDSKKFPKNIPKTFHINTPVCHGLPVIILCENFQKTKSFSDGRRMGMHGIPERVTVYEVSEQVCLAYFD
jgi:hypothetical protein